MREESHNQELQWELQHSSLHPLLLMASEALDHAGFGRVEIMGRRTSKQKSRDGGHELLCHAKIGNMSLRIPVKVVVKPARLRHLAELAGTVDRIGADMGIVLTPHPLSGSAREHRYAFKKSRIEVFDGPILADLCLRAGIGLSKGRVNHFYFEHLERLAPDVQRFLEEHR